MEDGRENAMRDAEARGLPGTDKRRYKWMSSILVPSRMRGMYLKPLEHVTSDAKVPFIRIMIALFGVAAVMIWTLSTLAQNAARSQFIAAPAVIGSIALCVMLVVFMISSRDKSMLVSLFDLNVFKLLERRREKAGLEFSSVGVSEVDENGEIKFDDGDIGVAYDARGQLSFSTLPQVADFVASVRSQYYVTRNSTSQEMRITSIEPNDFGSQLQFLAGCSEKLKESNDPGDEWRLSMCGIQEDYLKALVKEGRQLVVQQTVILRDTDPSQLQKTMRAFETIAQGGLYERIRLITDPAEVSRRLGGALLVSTVHDD